MKYINQYKTMLVREATSIPQFKIETPEDVSKLMKEEYRLDCLITEEVWAIFTNVKGDVVGVEQISKGGLDSAIVDPRSVFVPALHCNAAGIVLVHNHPSGSAKPSQQDVELTKRLSEAGKLLRISVLDHIIITNNNSFSMKEENII